MTPPGAVVSSEMVDRLIADQDLFLAEQKRARDIAAFLLAVSDWKINSMQREALGLRLDPSPVPPVGYVLPVEVVPTAPPPDFTPVVQPRSRFGIYPAPGDVNPAGTVIGNPFVAGKLLVKVVMEGPFGKSHWWEDKAA